MKRTSPKMVLGLNGAFSLVTGAFIAVAPASVGGWLGIELDGWLRVVGLILIIHALVLRWMMTDTHIRRWTRLNLAVIAPYPFIMLGLIVFSAITTGLGRALVLTDGLIVAGLAVLHAFALNVEETATPQPLS